MNLQDPSIPKKCCLTCHFLDTREEWLDGMGPDMGKKPMVGKTQHWQLSEDQRAHILTGDNVQQEGHLACWKDVWNSRADDQDASQDVDSTLTKSRGEECFFYPYTPGMAWEAAAELERREAERREAENDRRLTRRAFRLAFAALIVSILANLGSCVWDYWKYRHSHLPADSRQPVQIPADPADASRSAAP